MPRAYRNPKRRAINVIVSDVEQTSKISEDEDGCGSDYNSDTERALPSPKNAQSTSAKSTRSSTNISKRKKNKPEEVATPAPTLVSAETARGSHWQSSRQKYALPTPSVHHRHRATPLFSHPEKAERLTAPPNLFRPPELTTTNSFTQTEAIINRLGKTWGYNVGSGPLWELLEDRAWFKESLRNGPNPEKEGNRRPIVYPTVGFRMGVEILSEESARRYLPVEDHGCTELKEPFPVTCSFGPHSSQTKTKLKAYDTIKLDKYFPGSNALVINAGAPVWGLDWCPIHEADREGRAFKQYLAVSPFPSRTYSPEVGIRLPRPCYSCIQIWTLSSSPEAEETTEVGEMKCNMVLCIESGPAHELRWCPLPSHDKNSSFTDPKKLGLLAGTFLDGSLSIYCIPDPESLETDSSDRAGPLFVRLPEPLVRIELEETACWTFDWANSELIAVGCTNGVIAVYDVSDAIASGKGENTLPTHYITAHQSAIRALAWIRVPPVGPKGQSCFDDDPTVIASGGYDGVECVTDIREGSTSAINRTRDVVNTMTFAPFSCGPVTIDHENTVKAYSLAPSTLGRGHMLLEPRGPVWSVHASDYHPQLAVGVSDGSCLTTNMLRSTRKGGTVPHLLHTIYRLDYSRKSGEWRMLERFMPKEIQAGALKERDSKKTKNKDQNSASSTPSISTGVWPQEVGIHRVAWNNGNGMSASRLLASATASGLCRIDLLCGQWMREKIPYGGVANLRGEGTNGVEEETDSAEED